MGMKLLLAVEQRVDGRVELVAALEEIEFEDEDVAKQGAAELLDEGSSCLSGATCIAVSRNHHLSMVEKHVPVAMISSTTSTFCPGFTASPCIWKKSLPYSFS